MIFPIRTDRRMKHTPWVNYVLIAVNVVVFVMTMKQIAAMSHPQFQFIPAEQLVEQFPVLRYFLYSHTSNMHHGYQFFTYQFLHAGWEHLIFNMLFLFVFGNSLEDRLGPIGYLGFYLAGGVIAGLGHVMTSDASVIGASGSVSAVTGAYLALFPLSNVTMVYWFYFIGSFEVPSMYLILFSFALDVFNSFAGAGGVAYLAHISGNVFGFAVGMGLLWTRLLPREPFDFLALADRWNRRRQFRSATRRGAAPWRSQVEKVIAASDQPNPRDEETAQLRSSIAGHLAAGRQEYAMDDFEKLATVDPQAVLARQAQLDLANYAMQHERRELAAHAYEGFMRLYKTDEYRSQVEMILGLIYARYLNRPERAAELLKAALEKLDDESQKQMAREILSQLESA